MAQPLEPELKKRLLLGLLVVLAGGYLGYTQLYRPRAEALATLQQHVDALAGKNRTARALTQKEGRSEVEHRLASYRDQLGRVEGLIPSSEELPDLLDAISAQAQRNGVELSLIQPVGATQEKYYTRRTYDLAVLGSYHQVGAFLAEIASLPRIVTPEAMNVTVKSDSAVDRSGEPELEAKFSIETYVLPSPSTPPPDTSHAR